MKPNINLINAVFRIACGLTLLTIAGANFSKKPWCKGYVMYMFIGGLKAASGMLQFCPVTYVCQMTANEESNNNDKKSESATFNPS